MTRSAQCTPSMKGHSWQPAGPRHPAGSSPSTRGSTEGAARTEPSYQGEKGPRRASPRAPRPRAAGGGKAPPGHAVRAVSFTARPETPGFSLKQRCGGAGPAGQSPQAPAGQRSAGAGPETEPRREAAPHSPARRV